MGDGGLLAGSDWRATPHEAPLAVVLFAVGGSEADFLQDELHRAGFAVDARPVERLDQLAHALSQRTDLLLVGSSVSALVVSEILPIARTAPSAPPVVLLCDAETPERCVACRRGEHAECVRMRELVRLPPLVVRTLRQAAERRLLERNVTHLRLLSKTSQRLLASVVPAEVVGDLAARVTEHLGLDAFLVLGSADQGAGPQLLAAGGMDGERCQAAAIDADAMASAEPGQARDNADGLGFLAAWPLLSCGRRVGSLAFGARRRLQLKPDEQALIESFAGQLAAALDRERSATAAEHDRRDELERMNETLEARVAERTGELSRERAMLAAVLESLPVGVWLIDKQGRIYANNPAAGRIWAGARHTGLAGYGEYRGWWADSGREIAQEEWAATRAITQGETSLDELVRIQCFDGTTRTILNSAYPLRSEDGVIEGAIIVNQDVESLIQAQSALRASEERFRAAMDAMSDGLAVLAAERDESGIADLRIEYVNRRACEYSGVEAAALVGRTLLGLFPTDRPSPVLEELKGVIDGRGPVVRELYGRTLSGRRGWFELRATRLGEERAVVVVRDVTETRSLLDELAGREEQFRQLAERVPTVVWSALPDGTFDYTNLPGHRMRPAEATRTPPVWGDSIHADDAASALAAWHRALHDGEPYEMVQRIRNPEGEYRWVLVRAAPVQDAAGRVVRWYGTATDIHDERLLRQEISEAHASLEQRVQERTAELVAANERLRYQANLLDSVHEAVVATDSTMRITSFNRAAERLFGCRAEEVLGRGLEQIAHAHALELDWPAFHAVFDAHGCFQGIARHWTGGEERVIEWTAVRHGANGKGGTIGVLRDVTDRERAARSLEQYARRVGVLHEVDRAILAAHGSREIARLVAEHMRAVTGCERASVFVYDSEDGTAQAIAVAGLQDAGSTEGLRLPLYDIRIPDELRAGEPYVVDDLRQIASPCVEERILLAHHLRSRLSVPLLAEGRLIGALHLSSIRVRPFTPEQIEMVREVGASFAVALQNVRLHERLREREARLKTLSRRLVEVQEEERRALARELHDEAGQSLTALKVHLRLLDRELGDAARARGRITELNSMTGAVMESLHRAAQRLRPAVLDRAGLAAALRQLVDILRANGIEAGFEAHGATGDRLPLDVESTLFAIAQEATTNIVRHAGARHVSLTLEQGDSHVVALVEDDGSGFDVEAALASPRLGLRGMRERAELVGGELRIESEPGHGTVVRLELPL